LDNTQQPFDALLAWLDSDRDAAGRKYEIIRSGLIRIFVSQGFSDAEDLTDLTINRVVDRLPDIRETYVGEQARYFHGVARNIIREARRRKEIVTDRIPEVLTQVTNPSDKYECLLKCLELLPSERSELILDYYLYKGRDKIEHHRRMAEELGLTEGALRTRTHHIRIALEKCVMQCTKSLAEKQKVSWRALLKRREMIENTSQERQP
jgi:DNA-directed RNA polymerase specialized sigma24 family protein